MNKRDKIIFILFVLFFILALVFFFYARSEGTKCLINPLNYTYKMIGEEMTCTCITTSGKVLFVGANSKEMAMNRADELNQNRDNYAIPNNFTGIPKG